MIILTERTSIRTNARRCFDLARSVEVHLKGNVHFREQAVVTGGVTAGLVGPGEQVTWRAKHFGFWHELTSEITAFEPPGYFQDTMVRGIFKLMQHDHYFREVAPAETEMRDVFRFAAPLGILGWIAERMLLRRYMGALLRERNAVIKEVAEAGHGPCV